MNESKIIPVAEADLGYGQLTGILLRRIYWFGGVFCGVLVLTGIATLLEEPVFRSSMQLLVEPNYPSFQEGREEEELIRQRRSSFEVRFDYGTQLNLMRSQQFTEQVVERLKPEYPDLTVGDISGNLSLRQVREGSTETKVIETTYMGDDPVLARRVLEELKQVYQQYDLEQQELRLQRGLSVINQQLEEARKDLIESQRELEVFRRRQNLIDPEREALEIVSTLNGLGNSMRENRAQYEQTLAQYTALQERLGLSPQSAVITSRLSQSDRYQTLLNQFQQAELDLAQRRVHFTEADPGVQDLIDRRQQIMGLLQTEVARVLRGIPGQLNSRGDALLQEGQLGGIDINLVSNLVEAQVALQSLRARDRSLTEMEQQLRVQLDRYPGLIAEYDRLQPEVETRRTSLEQLLESKQRLSIDLARGGFGWQVVESPSEGTQVSPEPLKNLLLGIIVGVFMGGAAAFIREAADGVVHTSGELNRKVALPLLGIVPELPLPAMPTSLFNRTSQKLQTRTHDFDSIIHWLPFRESVDLIYKNIQLLSPGFGLKFKSLAVTSALPGEGKSTLAIGLALSAARLHQRVLLIDVNLRNPSLHTLLDIPNENGLSALLVGETNRPSLHSFSFSGSKFDVLPAGPNHRDPVQLLSSKRMSEMMTLFEQAYDLILLDASPVLGTVDAIQTASFCHGVVMVGRIDRITQSDLSQAMDMLNRLNVVGIVANGTSEGTSKYVSSAERNGTQPAHARQLVGEGQEFDHN